MWADEPLIGGPCDVEGPPLSHHDGFFNDHVRVSLDYDVRLNADDTTHLVGLIGEYRW